MINNISFTSNKTMAQQYLERKTAQIEANLSERIKEAGRVIINQNKEASRRGDYIPEGAYFGDVPVSPRGVNRPNLLEYFKQIKTNLPPVKTVQVQGNIVPENSINFIA